MSTRNEQWEKQYEKLDPKDLDDNGNLPSNHHLYMWLYRNKVRGLNGALKEEQETKLLSKIGTFDGSLNGKIWNDHFNELKDLYAKGLHPTSFDLKNWVKNVRGAYAHPER